MPPSLWLPRPKSMKDDEFIALDPGLLRHPSKTISQHRRQAAPGADASAFQGRPGARVALLQSPILPAAHPPYPQLRESRNIPVDNTHTCYRCVTGDYPALGRTRPPQLLRLLTTTSPYPHRRTPDPKRRTNMLAFSVSLKWRSCGQAQGLTGALQLGAQGQVVLVQRAQLGRRRS